MLTRYNLDSMSDEKLVVLGQSGNHAAINMIFLRYKSLVYSYCYKYYASGYEFDDMIQEAYIGLYEATRDFQRTKPGMRFRSFAHLCVNRQLITAIKAANRQKHIPLNSAYSLQNYINASEGQGKTYGDVISSSIMDEDPEVFFVHKETYQELIVELGAQLTDFEAQVLLRHLEGLSYKECACNLGINWKAVSNALYRVRKKLAKITRVQQDMISSI